MRPARTSVEGIRSSLAPQIEEAITSLSHTPALMAETTTREGSPLPLLPRKKFLPRVTSSTLTESPSKTADQPLFARVSAVRVSEEDELGPVMTSFAFEARSV